MAKKTTKKSSNPEKKKAARKHAKKAVKEAASKKAKREKHPYHHHIKISLLILAILTLILVIAAIASYPKLGEQGDIVAKVNGESITQAELDAQMARIPAELAGMVTEDVIVEQMVNELILLQEAENQGIIATAEEVDEIIQTTMIQLGLTQEELEERLAEQGMTEEELKELYLKQLKITKLVEQEVLPNIEVSEEELEEFYNSRIHARHILVDTEEEAEDIIDELNQGADFAELADEKSKDSMASGGDLGEFGKGQMVQPFEEAAYALDINEITQEPVETQFGFHVIQRLPRENTFEDSREDLELALQRQKQTDAITAYLQDLKSDADIELFTE